MRESSPLPGIYGDQDLMLTTGTIPSYQHPYFKATSHVLPPYDYNQAAGLPSDCPCSRMSYFAPREVAENPLTAQIAESYRYWKSLMRVPRATDKRTFTTLLFNEVLSRHYYQNSIIENSSHQNYRASLIRGAFDHPPYFLAQFPPSRRVSVASVSVVSSWKKPGVPAKT